MYFAGPFELKQGGLGIVGRFPVFQNNKFWGFSAVIIKLETFLKASGIKNVNDSKYYFQFSKYNVDKQKEIFYLPKQTDFSKKYRINRIIPDGDWKIYLISKNNNYLYSQIIIPGIIGIILATLFGILIYVLVKTPEELQSLVNTQATKLLNSEIKFKIIFDQAAVGIANVDIATGNFLEINNKFCELLGYTQNEMKQKNFQSITHPDDLETDLIHANKMKNGIINEYSMEKRYYTNHGKIIWVNLTVTPIIDRKNKQITTISIIEDITLKKEAEELIKKSEIRFKSLFDDSPLPLREEDILDVRRYLEELDLFGKTKETVTEFFNNNPAVVDKCHSLIKTISANRANLLLYKVSTLEELIITKKELFNSRSKEDFIKNLVSITQDNKQFIMDTVIKDAEGNLREINLRWNVIRGYEKTLERIIVSTEDITDRKLSEKIILSSQQRVESLINTIDGIVWECDVASFSFNFISQKVENILTLTRLIKDC